MAGAAFVRLLKSKEYHSLIAQNRAELGLICQAAVNEFFRKEKIDIVFLAAAKVGVILANSTYPARFIYENLAIQSNIIHAACESGLHRPLFPGSSRISPRQCPHNP